MGNLDQMNTMDLKDQVRQMVDSCQDENVLQEVLTLLHGAGSDWWLSLNDLEKERTANAMNELNKGQSLSHDSVMQAAWKKLGK